MEMPAILRDAIKLASEIRTPLLTAHEAIRTLAPGASGVLLLDPVKLAFSVVSRDPEPMLAALSDAGLHAHTDVDARWIKAGAFGNIFTKSPEPQGRRDYVDRLAVGFVLCSRLADTVKSASFAGSSMLSMVDYDKYRQVVWDPSTVGLTQRQRHVADSVVGAARLVPGGIGPGVVTPTQFGVLSAAANGDASGGQAGSFTSGLLAGAGLGALTNLSPARQQMYQHAGLAARLINKFVGTVLTGG